jgi:RNA polymerase sigma-70 factor (ECF subfamily)
VTTTGMNRNGTYARQEQYERLIRPYRSGLHSHAYQLTGNRADAEDLVQETLLRAYTRLDMLHGAGSVGGWLHTIQLNLFRNGLRRKGVVRDETALEFLEDVAAGGPDTPAAPDPETAVLARMRRDAIIGALARLPARYREPVYLCDVEERSYQEIADITGAPVGTVRSRINRGRKRLQRSLAGWSTVAA